MVRAALHEGYTDDLEVATADLRRVVIMHDNPITDLNNAKARMDAAELPAEAFGPSDEAKALVRYWNEAIDQRVADAKTCIDNIKDSGDKLHATVNNYIETEDKNAGGFRKDGGGEAGKEPMGPAGPPARGVR